MRIGYLLAEFPAQSHTWAWREYQTLKTLGIDAAIAATRQPPKITPHPWVQEAQSQTEYLIPFSRKDLALSLREILLAGPSAWLKCLGVVLNAEDMSFKQRLRLLALIIVSGKLAWLARTKGWSHIHSLYCSDAAHLAMFAAFLSRCTYSLTLLGPLEDFGPNQRQKWKWAAFALVMSNQLLKVVTKQLDGYLPASIRIAPMGADVEKNKRQTPYIPWNGTGTCRIYACGRLNVAKGYAYLLEAIALLRGQGFDVHLQIAGEDEKGGSGYRQDIEKLIQQKELSDCVELLGSVSEDRNRQGYEEAHIFALGSLEEGISVAVMEAMAMEVPVVMTDVGGMSELIDDGVDGILVPSQQANALAAAIAKIMQDPEFALNLSRASRQKVATQFYHQRSAEILAQELTRSNRTKLSSEPVTQPA
uniref:Colanic acid biosynthesis glycosyltransferase WcaL n=1 Tax=Oscillatoriales cyanobacterium SpSt-402 TaxID=2282168 RepID=A0A832M0Z8_9CYAN